MTEDQYTAMRHRMVETQIAARGLSDPRVLAAMEKVPRHRFIPSPLWDQAYSDYPLPIGEDQTISQPYIVALMTEILELKETDRVLEIGTGSGYQGAILAELAAQVFTIDRVASLLAQAERHPRLSGIQQHQDPGGGRHPGLARGHALRGHHRHRRRPPGAPAPDGAAGPGGAAGDSRGGPVVPNLDLRPQDRRRPEV